MKNGGSFHSYVSLPEGSVSGVSMRLVLFFFLMVLDGQLSQLDRTKVGPEFNFDRSKGPVSVKWLQGGKTNLSYNCLDRNIEQGNGSSVSTATLVTWIFLLPSYWCVLRRVAGWVAGGCWDDDITSDEMGSFPKIPCVWHHQAFRVSSGFV